MLRFSRSDDPPAQRAMRIVDGVGAKAWLAGMSQPGSVQNLDEIAQVLLTLGARGVHDGTASLTAERKFAIAERIRGVLLQILNERNAEDRYAVLPLDDEIVLQFWAAIDAAVALRDVYAWLVSQLSEAPVLSEVTLAGGGPATVGGGALISGIGALHRALDVDAQLLLCIQRARWSVPAALWERHCVLGQLVRDLDCQDIEVADALRVSVTKTCRAAFTLPVMVALADPAARGGAEYEVVRMAAQRWSAKVGFRLERRSDPAQYGLTRAPIAPARPIANPGPTVTLGGFVLRMDTQSAMQSIDKRLDAMAAGKSPREVGIGDALRPQVARELLLTLRQRWSAVSPAEIDSPDRLWRIAPKGVQVMAIVGMPTVKAKGRDGAPSMTGGSQGLYAYQRAHHDAITRPREEIENERIEQLLATAETWTLAAESSDAVRCFRNHKRPRIGLQRLVGLRLESATRDAPFLIGWVEALQAAADDRDGSPSRAGSDYTVRVRLAPGLPQMLHASLDDIELDYAFLLVPGVSSTGSGRAPRAAVFVPMLSHPGRNAESLSAMDNDGWDAVRASPRDYGLILPHASFRPQRLVKAVRRGVVAMLRLEELMMRGSDFDLVRFTSL